MTPAQVLALRPRPDYVLYEEPAAGRIGRSTIDARRSRRPQCPQILVLDG